MEEGSAILPMFSRRPLVTSEVTQRGSEAGESTGGSAATGKQQKDSRVGVAHTHIHCGSCQTRLSAPSSAAWACPEQAQWVRLGLH